MSDHEKVLQVVEMKDDPAWSFEPSRAALLIIDVQNYFVETHHPFGQLFDRLIPGLTKGYAERVKNLVLPNNRLLLQAFRSRKLPIIFTGTGTVVGDGRDLPLCFQNLDQAGSQVLGQKVFPAVSDPSYQIDSTLKPSEEETVINKLSSGAFAGTAIHEILREKKIRTLVVTGLTTDVCVAQNAREAADRGYDVVIASDACTTLSDTMHEVTLQIFSLAYGHVRSTEQILRMLDDAGRV